MSWDSDNASLRAMVSTLRESLAAKQDVISTLRECIAAKQEVISALKQSLADKQSIIELHAPPTDTIVETVSASIVEYKNEHQSRYPRSWDLVRLDAECTVHLRNNPSIWDAALAKAKADRAKRRRCDDLYLIMEKGNNRVKVGRSGCFPLRFKELCRNAQLHGQAQLEIIEVFQSLGYLEKNAHDELSKASDSEHIGEWFMVEPSVALELIRKIVRDNN